MFFFHTGFSSRTAHFPAFRLSCFPAFRFCKRGRSARTNLPEPKIRESENLKALMLLPQKRKRLKPLAALARTRDEVRKTSPSREGRIEGGKCWLLLSKPKHITLRWSFPPVHIRRELPTSRPRWGGRVFRIFRSSTFFRSTSTLCNKFFNILKGSFSLTLRCVLAFVA